MRNFKLFEKTSIKVISAVLLFLIFTGVISWAISFPFDRIYANSNRYEIAFVGASETEWGISPPVIDGVSGKKSYLLATSGCTLDGRYEMIKSALKQDSLKMVVIDSAYFALRKNMSNFELDKRVLYYSRLSGLSSQVDAALNGFSFWDDEYDSLYAEKIYEGSGAWKKIIKGNYANYSYLRGYDPQGNTSQLLSEKEAVESYNKETLNTDFRDENIARLEDIISLCRENDAVPILITLPLSERYIWQNDGWDDFHDVMTEIAERNDVAYYDFNLIKERGNYLSDEYSYRDEEHLCDAGVQSFSRVLAEIIAPRESSKNSYEFYDSYEEAKRNSVYAQYMDW